MPIHSVDAATLKHWIETGQAVVLDVREPHEHVAENISCATLLPLANVAKANLPDYRGKKLVVHCKAGGRSLSACQKLLQEDPSLELYNLDGGMGAWTQVCNR